MNLRVGWTEVEELYSSRKGVQRIEEHLAWESQKKSACLGRKEVVSLQTKSVTKFPTIPNDFD